MADMATVATYRRLADKCRASIERILDSDTAAWSEGERRQQMLEVDRLEALASDYDAKASRASGRSILSPVKRVGV